AVGGRHDRARFRGNHAIRITKEREHKQSKEHRYSGGKIPMKQESGATGYERRQPKVIAFFDHADARRPPPFRSRFSRGEQAWPFYDSFLCRKAGIAWILLLPQNPRSNPLHFILTEIGRASCRERVSIAKVEVA